MFIDDEFKRHDGSDTLEEKDSFLKTHPFVLALILFLTFALLVGLVFFFFTYSKSTTVLPEIKKTDVTKIETVGGLPITYDDYINNFNSQDLNNLEVEYLSFSNFYQEPDFSLDFSFNDFSLPINVKADVKNYYDMARKINLDSGLDSLNNNGFAIVDSPEADTDFYNLYEILQEKEISPMVSSDFLVYYYQNTLKQTFHDIESLVFYENLWVISQRLYEISKNRYEARLSQVGDINDPLLEAERKATAYFAVALELLQPKSNQVDTSTIISDGIKFSPKEAEKFSFSIPNYLREDVSQETNLIYKAEGISKSPVMLYERDYNDFSPPIVYQKNARLYNFYLATHWLNSVFPLYYQSDVCPNCLLDKDDWRISTISAFLISKDIAEQSELKTKWARIYKVMYFFKGLRHDLNYVYYRDAYKNVFSSDNILEEKFSGDRDVVDVNLAQLQIALTKYDFVPTEGAWDKNNPVDFPKLGFKVLSENYWPNSYIFNKLSYPEVGQYLGTGKQRDNNTSCKVRTSDKVENRCQSIILDFVGLITDIKNKTPYFLENINYDRYADKQEELKQNIATFPTWHNNNYWASMDLMNTWLNKSSAVMPVFSKNDAWQERNIQGSLGLWLNMQLPVDKFSINAGITGGNQIGSFVSTGEGVYIEPNLYLIRHLRSNTRMIIDMFNALKVSEDIASVNIRLQELSNDLETMEKLVTKELKNEEMTQEEQRFLNDFINKYSVEKASTEKIVLDQEKGKIKYSLDDLKLLVVVHPNLNGDLTMSAGPIFSYQESK